MRAALAFLALAGCNQILGIPAVELETCISPTVPRSGYGTVTFTGGTAVNDLSTRITLRANLDQAARPDRFQLELFDGTSFGGVDMDPVPNVYSIADSEVNYRTCGICARIFTNVDAGGVGVHIYMAESGTLRLTSTVGRLTGSIEDATFREVEIDPTANFETTNSPTNCKTTITRAEFDFPLIDGGGLDAL